LAIAFNAARRLWVGSLATVALCVISALVIVNVADNVAYQKPDYRALAAILRVGPPSRAILFGSTNTPVPRYLPDARWMRAGEALTLSNVDAVIEGRVPSRTCRHFAGLACENLVLETLPAELRERFTVTQRVELDGFVVLRYHATRPVRVRFPQFVANDRRPGLLVRTATPDVDSTTSGRRRSRPPR
jgi:hypothetical protein